MKNQNNNSMNINTNNDLDDINNPYDLNKGKIARHMLESKLREELAALVSKYTKEVNTAVLKNTELSFCFISKEYDKLDSLNPKMRNIKEKALNNHLESQLRITESISVRNEEFLKHIIETYSHLKND